MGGKVWSDEEERVFWTEIIPSSNKRHLLDRPHSHDAKGWEDLRQVMQQRMGRLARRRYTALMLYEHFFQNSVLERFSPHATRYVRAYIANERATTGAAPSQRSRSNQRFVRRGSGSGRRPNITRVTPTPAAQDPVQKQEDGGQGSGVHVRTNGFGSGYGNGFDNGFSDGFGNGFDNGASSVANGTSNNSNFGGSNGYGLPPLTPHPQRTPLPLLPPLHPHQTLPPLSPSLAAWTPRAGAGFLPLPPPLPYHNGASSLCEPDYELTYASGPSYQYDHHAAPQYAPPPAAPATSGFVKAEQDSPVPPKAPTPQHKEEEMFVGQWTV